MQRLLFLDSLRGLAALAVVYFHYTSVYRHLYGHSFSEHYDFDFGLYGVEFFFMISGFVIFLTLSRISSARDFLFNRAVRLYPAYIVCLLLTFGCVQYFGLEGLETSFSDMLVNLTMFQKAVGVPDVDGVYWSLFSEWMFYLLMVTLFVFRKLDKMLWVGAAWLVLNVINMHFVHLGYAARLLNLYHGVFFYSGILFYMLYTGTGRRTIVQLHLAAAFVVALSLFALEGWADMIVAALLYGVFYLGINGRLEFLVNRPLLFLGSISYALYLFHQYIGFIIINQTKAYFGDSVLVIVPPLVVSIVCAYLITQYIEQPAVKFLKSKYKHFTTRQVPRGAESGFTSRQIPEKSKAVSGL
ncbi:acyltransferase [Pontibacter sp. Tf4]|uniref:acyltransferase family protein n=1 Tax=Pontibacter sp. Tf4 TaxID=2761620 RepID=UPI001628AD60|nr:acyltransferase [Pontibacter sp. Tf4]MBB6610919.1 acyltransferase [Pontibacter sp. Tf4]